MPETKIPAAVKRPPQRKLHAATAAPLTLPAPPEKTTAREQVLAVLFRLALEGNVSAAKLYLDCVESGDDGGLSAEAALKILQEHSRQ